MEAEERSERRAGRPSNSAGPGPGPIRSAGGNRQTQEPADCCLVSGTLRLAVESQTAPTAGAARLRSAAHMSQTAVIMGLTTAGRGHPELACARWRDSSLVMSAVWLAGGGMKWTGAPKPVKIIVAAALPLRRPPVAAAGTGAWNRICRTRWRASIHTSTGNEAMLRALISPRTSWASLAPSVACTLAATLSRLTCARYSVAGTPATVAWPAWDTPLETAN